MFVGSTQDEATSSTHNWSQGSLPGMTSNVRRYWQLVVLPALAAAVLTFSLMAAYQMGGAHARSVASPRHRAFSGCWCCSLLLSPLSPACLPPSHGLAGPISFRASQCPIRSRSCPAAQSRWWSRPWCCLGGRPSLFAVWSPSPAACLPPLSFDQRRNGSVLARFMVIWLLRANREGVR